MERDQNQSENVANSSDKVISRIDSALDRIEAASAMINSRTKIKSNGAGSAETQPLPSSAKVMALINQHEAMREEVAGTLRDLDTIIGNLEDGAAS